ncbi:hypothetical protein M707_23470 [Arthrobacter sp. AK-YN10]|nr:hypothetical protein M707_23470 [Arthrobacter sp. AK-YN10]
MSAQSRSVRMHVASSVTISSPKHASAQAPQICAHSKHAAMHSDSFSLSTIAVGFGWESIIALMWWVMVLLLTLISKRPARSAVRPTLDLERAKP